MLSTNGTFIYFPAILCEAVEEGLTFGTDKTIKLWKLYEKKIKAVANFNVDKTSSKPPKVSTLKIPQVDNRDSVMAAVPRRVYANAHAYHINSISINSDGETYISSDDLRINLWSLNISDQSFSKFEFWCPFLCFGLLAIAHL